MLSLKRSIARVGKKPIIGMVHLEPLPYSPRWTEHPAPLSLDHLAERALDDARSLLDGGIDAVLFENFHDNPYPKDVSEPITVGAFAIILHEVVRRLSLSEHVPFGVNVLRNDWRSALSLARLVNAAFIRVNVLDSATVTDQGIIEGDARALHLFRQRFDPTGSIAVYADVHVKHAAPLAARPIAEAAADTAHRNLADGVIVSGPGTGRATSGRELIAVKEALPEVPVIIGSGLGLENAEALLAHADGAIVGSALKRGGDVEQPVDRQRVEALMERARSVRD